jgi:ABC-type nickel/cobalt efflux system permease component RcnA
MASLVCLIFFSIHALVSFSTSLLSCPDAIIVLMFCKINQTLQTLTTDVHCFGEVTTSITPCDITLVKRKDKQAQMMVAGVPARSISNICLKLKNQDQQV